MQRIVLVAIFLLISVPCAAQVFKCRAADGSVSYSDRPCQGGAAQSEMAVDRSPESGGASALTSHCSDSDFAAPIPPQWDSRQERDALRAQWDAVKVRMNPEQRTAFNAMGYGLALSKSAVGVGFRDSGAMHICVHNAAKGELEFIVRPDGRIFEFKGARFEEINPSITPTGRLDACAAAMTNCSSGIEPDRCIGQVTVCGAASSPECCPQQCKQAYLSRRRGGESSQTAIMGVLFGADSCVLGVKEALGR